MGDIVKFSEYGKLKFDKILTQNPYLRVSAMNGLNLAGYSATIKGVLQYKKDNGLKVEPKLTIEDLPYLLVYFDPETRQEIVNNLESALKMKKEKKNSSVTAIIFLIELLFFELYGIISCIIDIIHIFKK